MAKLERLQIDYSNYRETDKATLRNIDPTKSDEVLAAEDMLKLNTHQLNEIYQIFRTYKLDSNGYSVKSAQAGRILDFVNKSMETPKKYVRKAARNNQFLIFGETHMSPKTRKFMASMLKTLREEGFSHLAIEVDTQKQSIIDEYMRTGNRSALSKLKMMSNEFIGILDAARKEGLKISCIDDTAYHQGGKDRGYVDKVMFSHLKQQVLDKNPKVKVAIYIGTGHIDETEYLNFIRDGRIFDTPTKVGKLGYLLEKYAPGKSHSISIADSNAPDCISGLGEFLGSKISRPFAISLDFPFLHTITGPIAFIHKNTYGGSYDALIGL